MSSASIDAKYAELSFNGRLLLKEMDRRGITLKSLDDTYIVAADYGDHHELLYDVYTSLSPYPAGVIIDDKYLSKAFLQSHSFKVAPGKTFSYDNVSAALNYAQQIDYPVVLKPTIGSHGDYVFMDISDGKELKAKIELLQSKQVGNGYYLVEKQVGGKEYRLFVTSDGFFAAVNRVPANVIGDGIHNIQALVDKENNRRMNPRDTCLCEIRLDQPALDYMDKNHLALADVPKIAEAVYLRNNSNVSTGGNCYEMTGQAHPSVIKLAQDILAKLKVPYIGIDLLCEAIDKPLDEYAICELNGAPGLSLHMMPESGQSQDTAKAVVDVLFPETKK